ncbi:unnamed protein product [Sphagnum compactum]
MRTVAKEGLHGRGLVSDRSMEDRTVTSHPQSGIVKLQGGDGRCFWCCVAFFLPVCGLEKGRKEGGTAAETSERYLRLFRSSFLTPTLHLVRNILRSIEGLFVAVIG